MFSERNIWLCNPSLVEKLFTNSTKTNFFCRALSTNGFKELGMHKVGIGFNRDFESWKYNRRILNYTLTNIKVLKGYMNAVKNLFVEIEGYWKDLNFENNEESKEIDEFVIDFSQWMRRFITDLALNMNLGDHAFSMAGYYNFLCKNKKQRTSEIIESEKFIKSFVTWVKHIIFMTFCPSNFIRHYIPPISFFQLRFQSNYNWLTNEFSRIIQKRKQEIENVPLDKLDRYDVLNTLLTVNKVQELKGNNEMAIRSMNESEIFGVLLEFFVAGVETILSLTCFIVYYVCKHPSVKQKLIQEIDSVFPTTLPSSDIITYEKLMNNLPYCDAIVKETSRLKTNPPINPRELYEQDEIGGYTIPKGATVIASVDAIHLHKDYWEKPTEFIPERFLSNDYPLSMSQKLLTFGGGLRGCVGKQVAMVEVKTILVLLFRKYDIELVNENMDAKDKTYLLNSCSQLMIRLKPRTVA
ncbi:16172_t:CDS:2 [Cetraspora pellucida]|uniref:16172_t:CDS:1 n=1 Tax=Cetraspora pellucida TaxID=1433469 RepID=A0ACA9KQK2_9GLOM|nr:16172_t:CDS:2 [Cetraspora pellucida]